ncbi:probable ATP-dependent RNA helicase CG8611 [Anopheles gambiae]|uniref:ATP-dependent RNA helicase n=2 Tax=Anopheles coluzzii TaxID=1518534 RepID=A0A6E8W253_ANOCL|nr:probable ATP-dependent RNA helicase CG8611 [Anopheles gambiae]
MDIILSNFIVDEHPQVSEPPKNTSTAVNNKDEIPIRFTKVPTGKAIIAKKRPQVSVQNSASNEKSRPRENGESKGNVPSSDEKRPKEQVVKQEKRQLKTETPAYRLLLSKPTDSIRPPEVRPFQEKLFSEQSFDSLDIHPHSKKNIADLLQYEHLTTVQSMAIPSLLKGTDALIRAQTGSGKTLAYALPLIERLHTIRPQIHRSDGIRAVVIVPTRELAVQTYELIQKLLKPFTWIVPGYLTGGEKRKTEKARLRAGLNILIATPGRLCDHIRNTESLKFGSVCCLVLDEADRLLELGYETDVKQIIEAMREAREEKDENEAMKMQTVLLSATLTASVKELAGLTLQDPVYVETSEVVPRETPSVEQGANICTDQLLNVGDYVSIPATVKQRYLVTVPKQRLVALSALIVHEQRQKPSKILVFMATQDLVNFHYDVMTEVLTLQKFGTTVDNEASESEEDINGDNNGPTDSSNVLLPGLKFYKLHGHMTQLERISVFNEFRKATAAVLICTDVAARGIDIPLVDLVVQYHAPQILADYVHRVGRTARAGHTGKAVIFLEPAEQEFIQYLTDKHIRIQEQKIDGIIKNFGLFVNRNQKRKPINKIHWAYEIQHRYERLIKKEDQLFDSAKKAYVSWVRYYSNFQKELRNIFCIKAIHLGHYAKCLGLSEAPKQLLQYHTDTKQDKASKASSQRSRNSNKLHRRDENKQSKSVSKNRNPDDSRSRKRGLEQPGKSMGLQKLIDLSSRSRVLNTSEFGSGFETVRKKAKIN